MMLMMFFIIGRLSAPLSGSVESSRLMRAGRGSRRYALNKKKDQ